jgi:bifunctional NMN adenylyltransferase/nudix hydrolase
MSCAEWIAKPTEMVRVVSASSARRDKDIDLTYKFQQESGQDRINQVSKEEESRCVVATVPIVKPSFGIVVGRFQTDCLHEGHLALLTEVGERHNHRVIVFLGSPSTSPTKRDPLDFETRSQMIKATYPDYQVVPLKDKKTDEIWSRELDERIADIVGFGKVTLYGSRDSFVPHYKGVHAVQELVLHANLKVHSATAIRNAITNKVMASPDFRRGIIYDQLNSWTRTIPCVDIAPMYKGTPDKNFPTGNMILLGKKKEESLWRFIGGHAEDGSYEDDARRECMEECGLSIARLEYVTSGIIEDWRYRDTPERIKSMLFIGWTNGQGAKAGDDINEVKWFDLSKLDSTMIEVEHRPFFETLLKHNSVRLASRRHGAGSVSAYQD